MKTCPINPNHTVTEKEFATFRFNLCEDCHEDVAELEQKLTNFENEDVEELQDDQYDTDDCGVDTVLDNEPHVPTVMDRLCNLMSQQRQNPVPSRNMGEGDHTIVLISDDSVCGDWVHLLVSEVFNKQIYEVMYLTAQAHYEGSVPVFRCSKEQSEVLLKSIEDKKTEIISSGFPGADTLQKLQFRVE